MTVFAAAMDTLFADEQQQRSGNHQAIIEQGNERNGLCEQAQVVDLTVVIDAVEQAMAQRLQRPGTTLNRALGTASNPIRAR